MQPYVFPYIGYFQLIYATDKFVFYDDVDFIKGGWINRNKILINKKEHLFTVPLKEASSFNLINETVLHPVIYQKWKTKFLKSLSQTYCKAKYFNEVFPIIQKVFESKNDISNLAMESILEFMDYLDVERDFYLSSRDFPDTKGMERANRIIEITNRLGGDSYINMPGGKKLYGKEFFAEHKIKLEFLQPSISVYDQNMNGFVPGLSIIDILMYCSKRQVHEILKDYKLQ
jgi:hypothetical protein